MKERLNLYDDTRDLEFFQLGPFKVMIMERKVTTNTTTLRRINTHKALVYGGNCNGVVGYGKGRGRTSRIAMDNAIENFKQNVIAINLDLMNTCPKSIYAKFGRFEIALFTQRSCNSWGSPTMAAMIQIAGIHHCSFKFNYDKPKPYLMVYCLMKLFTQNTTPKLLAEQTGVKLYDTVWSRRVGGDNEAYGLV